MSDTAEASRSEKTEANQIEHEELVHLSTSEKEQERLRLQAEIEMYLASGGKIREIPVNVMADPPKRPESNYGGQPI